MEAAGAGATLRPARADGDHLPLSHRLFQVEPVEHRLFGPISINWAAKPLRTFDTPLAAMRGTTTRTGLTVEARRLEGIYPTGRRVSKAEMNRLNMTRHDPCPKWTYTIRPRDPALTTAPNRELIA